MKRLIPLIVSILGFGCLVYFFYIYEIIPEKSDLEAYDYLIYSLAVILPVLIGVFAMLFFYRKKDKKITWLKNRLEQWSNLSVHVNKAGDEVFSELPLGIMIYDEQYEIKWVNRFSKKIFNNELLEQKISDINIELQEKISLEEKKFIVEEKGKFYEVVHKTESRILYLFDITKRVEISNQYEGRTPAIGVIIMDNLEMETKGFDIQETVRLRGLYLGEISKWCERHNAYLKSYDDDSLVIALDKKSLLTMMSEKFDVLDKIRVISEENGIRVTLSLGIACGDVSYEELGAHAQSAINLAEKRGGDQVVVNILGEKIQYFGAKSNALEKNNLSAARANTLALKEAVDVSSNVYIMGHMMADCDALGAMIGTLRMALSSEKVVKVVIDYDRIDVTSQKLYNEIKSHEPELFSHFISSSEVTDINNESLLLLVDTQSPKIAMNENVLNRFRRIAVIDHHRSSDDGFADPVFSYIEPYASSTVELVSEMLNFYQKERIEISAFEATVMLAGVVVDTNNFTFRCGTRTFEAAANLREYGADMIEIRRMLRNELELQLSLAKYVQLSEIILENFAITVVDEKEIITDRTMLAKISEQLLNIENMEAAFAIAHITDGERHGVAISARSYKSVNVQLIMEEMGGGGHLNSAATQIYGVTCAQVKEDLITILKRDFEIGDEFMKVILLEDVKGRGVKNQVIDVAVGYGNYLISNKKGIPATDENLASLKEQLHQEQLQAEEQKKMMLKIKEEIEEKTVNIYIKIGSDGKLFGHVTTKQIVDEFEVQTGIRLDKRKVNLPVEITGLGVYAAIVDLHKEVKANLAINVLEK